MTVSRIWRGARFVALLLAVSLLAACATVPVAAPAGSEAAAPAATEAAAPEAAAPAEGAMAPTAGGFPDKALQIMAPANPGGGWDQTARSMEQALKASGAIKTAQVTNKGGAGGAVGLPGPTPLCVRPEPVGMNGRGRG